MTSFVNQRGCLLKELTRRVPRLLAPSLSVFQWSVMSFCHRANLRSLAGQAQTVRFCAWLCIVLAPLVVDAQVVPGLGYVFPPAVQRGQASKVQLGGYDFTPDLQFFVHDLTIKLKPTGQLSEFFVPEPPYWFGLKGFSTAYPIPREFSVELDIPASHPGGLVHWQVANANGSSSTAVFYVSDRLEVVEDRWRDHDVQVLDQLPIGVSGRVRKISEVDRYAFTATKSGPLTVELMARRLGANFNAVVEIRDNSGKLIVDAADTEGRDINVTFPAKAKQQLVARVFDMDFRGNRAYVYRLGITESPRVIATIPARGKAGETRNVEFIGYGIATGGGKLESVRQQVKFVATNASSRQGTQSICTHVLKTKFGDVAVEIPLTDRVEFVEVQQPKELSLPCAITGKLSAVGEQDVYTFKAAKGDSFTVNLRAESIDSRLDVAFDIKDSTDAIVLTNDDAKGTTCGDASGLFLAKKDDEYTCVVRDTAHREGQLDSIYRLELGDSTRPGFMLSFVQRLSSAVPGKATLKVTAKRTGSFLGEIAIKIDGVPAGISIPADLKILEKKNEVSVVFEVAEKSATQAALIRVSGSAEVDGQKIQRRATSPATGNLSSNSRWGKSTEFGLLATTMKPPFSLLLVDRNRQRTVNRGTTYPAPFQIEREASFKDEIFVLMTSKQSRHRQGITGPILTVPAKAKDALYPCFMPEWLATDKTTRMQVMGMARVPDAKGNIRYLTKNSNARITMILEGRLMKIAQHTTELTAKPGDTVEIPVSITRTPQFAGPVIVSIDIPKRLREFLTVEPVSIGTQATTAKLILQTKASEKLEGDWEFTIKCTGMQDERWPLVTQTQLPVRFVGASKTASLSE